MKNKKVVLLSQISRKYAFFLTKLVFSYYYANLPFQRRGIGENAVFLLLTGRHKRVKLENNGCLGTGARTTLQKISKVDIGHIDVLPQSMICYMLHFLTKEINPYFTLKFINFFPVD